MAIPRGLAAPPFALLRCGSNFVLILKYHYSHFLGGMLAYA